MLEVIRNELMPNINQAHPPLALILNSLYHYTFDKKYIVSSRPSAYIMDTKESPGLPFFWIG